MSNATLLTVLAKDFSASGSNTLKESPYYSNLTVTSGETGYIEWRIEFPVAGKYQLHALMTAAQSRPCVLSINAIAQDSPIFGEVTGGWNSDTLQTFVYGPYDFKQGENLLRIDFTQYQPHLKEFSFSLVEEKPSVEESAAAVDATTDAQPTETSAAAEPAETLGQTTAEEPTAIQPALQNNASPAEAAAHIVKLIGETRFLPGFSLLVDGKVLEGGAHAAVGVAALPLLGPVGPAVWLLAAANSYSKSVTDKHLHEHIKALFGK
jgi:hypothetical protein